METFLPLTDDKMTGLKLQCEVDSVPQVVCTRLPDKYMTLQSQIQASEAQKQAAFLDFINEEVHHHNLQIWTFYEVRYLKYVTKYGL